MTEAEDKLTRAKSKLVIAHPFFASLICALPMTENNDIPTMATNGKRIIYNTEFVLNMSDQETLFVLCHEVGHCMFGHMFRRGSRDQKRWNIAGDHIINDMLVTDGIGSMPPGGLHDLSLIAQGGGTTDGIYALLPENPGGSEGYNGTGIDLCEDATGDEAERTQAEAEMKVQIAQAAQAAKMQGKLSATLARLVDAALRPQVSWVDVLRRFISAKAKNTYSYARPKRRFVADDLYLPSLSGLKLGEFVVAVDCSGSIDAETLNVFGAEIKAIFELTKPEKLHVVYFDSEVSHHDAFGAEDDLHIEGHGGGGTAFSPIFKFLADNDIEPVGCVVLTDLYCNDFGPVPDYPVLWVSNAKTDAPWGEIIKIN